MTTGLGPTDLIEIFSTVFANVTSIRASRGLPALKSTHLGAEWIRSEESPPRIVVVPTTNTYEFSRIMGEQPGSGVVTDVNPPTICTRLMHFEAHFWGDDTPTPSNPPVENPDLWYSFNSTIEIEREFIGALMRNLGNVTNPRSGMNVRFADSRWSQPTDMTRTGRMLILPFAIGTIVTDEPWVTTPTSSIDVDMTMTFPDATSSHQGVIIIS